MGGILSEGNHVAKVGEVGFELPEREPNHKEGNAVENEVDERVLKGHEAVDK